VADYLKPVMKNFNQIIVNWSSNFFCSIDTLSLIYLNFQIFQKLSILFTNKNWQMKFQYQYFSGIIQYENIYRNAKEFLKVL